VMALGVPCIIERGSKLDGRLPAGVHDGAAGLTNARSSQPPDAYWASAKAPHISVVLKDAKI
tara:strand:- start:21194 stop:21379 length:186 start_codon:yes stop_codon:yes gene_type:complete